MNKRQTTLLKNQYRQCQQILSMARRKPWLASYLLRRLRQIQQQMKTYAQQVWLTMGLVRPRQARRWLKRRVMPLMAGGGLVLLLNVGLVQANGITVTHTTDAIGNGDGCSLREAVINANNNDQSGSTDCAPGSGPDTISLPNGTILLALTGADEDLAATGDLDITSPITINGQGMNQSVIDGNGSDRIFHVLPGADLTLTGMTVQGGQVITGAGGGILNQNGAVALTNVKITGNSALTPGPTLPINLPSLAPLAGAPTVREHIQPNLGQRTSDSPLPELTLSSSQDQAIDSSPIQPTLQAQMAVTPPRPGVGGGIFSSALTGTARLAITNSIISGNDATLTGGGVVNYARNGMAEATIAAGSVISNNVSLAAGGLSNLALTDGTIQAVVTDSTIRQNVAGGPSGGGGGLHNLGVFGGQSKLEVINSTITGNTSAANGGGITNYGASLGIATTQLSNSTLSGNTVSEWGGGVQNSASSGGRANLTLTNRSVITGHQNALSGGGVSNVAVYGSTTAMTMTNSTISQNSSQSGGGVNNYALFGGSQTHTVTNSTISGNTTTGPGSGINSFFLFSDSLSLEVTNSAVTGNSTGAYGGGLYSGSIYSAPASIAIKNSTISGNQAGSDGGGLYAYSYDSSIQLTLSNSTISGNKAVRDAGGISNYAYGSQLNKITVVNSTVTNNSADSDNDGLGDGGGIYSNTPLTMTNSIVAGNFDTPNNAGPGKIHPDAHNQVMGNATNLVGNTSGITGTLGTGSDIVTGTLGLGPLADNGGPATASGAPPFTHALLEGSPAIDAADAIVCAAPPINSLDQRGQPRPGAETLGCDIGAYEFQTPPPGPTLLYLPLLLKDHALASDLVIDSLTVGSGGITVTIRNAGTASITDAFWLDVYFNPSQVPGLNQPWNTIAPAGAVWGVTKSLAPGEVLTLTVGDAYYVAGESSSSFPAGATVYGFVDSINHNTGFGNVQEGNEGNNLSGPVTSTAGSPSWSNSSPTPGSQDGLPKRN